MTGGAEERHYGIADVLVDHPAMTLNNRAHAIEVAVKESQDLGWRQLFAERGEVAQVGEEDRYLSFGSPELEVGLEELGGDLR